MSEEEIIEKLRLLKRYSQDFSLWEAHWKTYGGKRAAYQAMMQAERSYVELSDWLYRQGIMADWDREKQEYVVRVLSHTHNDVETDGQVARCRVAISDTPQ